MGEMVCNIWWELFGSQPDSTSLSVLELSEVSKMCKKKPMAPSVTKRYPTTTDDKKSKQEIQNSMGAVNSLRNKGSYIDCADRIKKLERGE